MLGVDGTAWDVVALFLSGPAGRWITGQTVVVDGGGSLGVEPEVHPDATWSVGALNVTF
jgi:hypothetical protein